MVAQAEQRKRDKKRRIWTPGSDIDDIAEAFKEETVFMLKKIALENGCSVEELKFTVDNFGIVNVQGMTEEEIKEAEYNRQRKKFIKHTMRAKGHDA